MRKLASLYVLVVAVAVFPPSGEATTLPVITLTPGAFSSSFNVSSPVFDFTGPFARMEPDFGFTGFVRHVAFPHNTDPNQFFQAFQIHFDLIFSAIPGRGALQELRMQFTGLVGIQAFVITGPVGPLTAAGTFSPSSVLIQPIAPNGTLQFVFDDISGANLNSLVFGVISNNPSPTSAFGLIDVRGGEMPVLLTPEPGALLLLGTGLPLVAALRRFYRRAHRKT